MRESRIKKEKKGELKAGSRVREGGIGILDVIMYLYGGKARGRKLTATSSIVTCPLDQERVTQGERTRGRTYCLCQGQNNTYGARPETTPKVRGRYHPRRTKSARGKVGERSTTKERRRNRLLRGGTD